MSPCGLSDSRHGDRSAHVARWTPESQPDAPCVSDVAPSVDPEDGSSEIGDTAESDHQQTPTKACVACARRTNSDLGHGVPEIRSRLLHGSRDMHSTSCESPGLVVISPPRPAARNSALALTRPPVVFSSSSCSASLAVRSGRYARSAARTPDTIGAEYEVPFPSSEPTSRPGDFDPHPRLVRSKPAPRLENEQSAPVASLAPAAITSGNRAGYPIAPPVFPAPATTFTERSARRATMRFSSQFSSD